jgi:hypothetical protein
VCVSWSREIMRKRIFILITISLGIILLAFIALIAWSWFNDDGIKILIATDKTEYSVGETVHIRITNYEDHTVDIYCPMTCALGNFPTTVERLGNEDWEYFAGFCPSIDPLFGNYPTKKDFIIHSLDPGQSFDLEISNFEALHIQKVEQLRIMYYTNTGTSTILSAPFTMKP